MKHFQLLSILSLIIFAACSSKKSSATSAGTGSNRKPQLSQDGSFFMMSQVSDDTTYGYSKDNPVKVGYNGSAKGPENERKYLDGLTGPNGEEVSYNRLGSCCFFEAKELAMGGGMLDRYSVRWKGIDEPKVIYINMYQYEDVKAPKGFSVRKN